MKLSIVKPQQPAHYVRGDQLVPGRAYVAKCEEGTPFPKRIIYVEDSNLVMFYPHEDRVSTFLRSWATSSEEYVEWKGTLQITYG